MNNDFIVKVYRYWEEDNGSRGWDGWYYSKVYAIDGDEFLVYDDGGMSAYNGEEDFCETGFNWVDFTATMDRCGENGRQPIVEPLASFNIADYLADRKTEPQILVTTDADWKEARDRIEELLNEPHTEGVYTLTLAEAKQRAVDIIESVTQTETQNSNLTFEKRTMLDCYNCKRFDTEDECIECLYEPKDEPQTERSE